MNVAAPVLIEPALTGWRPTAVPGERAALAEALSVAESQLDRAAVLLAQGDLAHRQCDYRGAAALYGMARDELNALEA